MIELEREKTYLLARLPKDLASCKSEIIRDAFVSAAYGHPVLRLRQRGDRYEITKKQLVDGQDASRQEEHTIQLTREEFDVLNAVPAKRFAKRRYYLNIDGHNAEVDVYLEGLAGLAIVDFEFAGDEAMQAFTMLPICLADVTQEEQLAGGMLAGKTYQDLQPILDKYNYKPLTLEEQS